jgi:hypothetical protein
MTYYSFDSGTSDYSRSSKDSIISGLVKLDKDIYLSKISKVSQYIFDNKLVTVVGEIHNDTTNCSEKNSKDVMGLYKILNKPIVITEGISGSYNFDNIARNINNYIYKNVREYITKEVYDLYYKNISRVNASEILKKFMVPLQTYLRQNINIEKLKLKLYNTFNKEHHSKEIYFSNVWLAYYEKHLKDLDPFIKYYNKRKDEQISSNAIKMLRYIYAFMEDIQYIKTIVNSNEKDFMIMCGTFHYNNIIRFFRDIGCRKIFKKSRSNNCLGIKNIFIPAQVIHEPIKQQIKKIKIKKHE